MPDIRTSRLRLVCANLELLRLDKGGREGLAAGLGVEVPATWPPEHYDQAAVEWLIGAMEADPAAEDWMLYYVVLEDEGAPKLVGAAGYKGRADAEGCVEIGYGVVSDYQRRGIASEAANALVHHAFRFPEVRRVTAATLPGHVASLGVMERCGMRFLGDGPEAGTVLYGIDRAESAASDSVQWVS